MASTVSWFTCAYPVALSKKTNLRQTIEATRDTLHSVPEKGIGYGILRYLAGHTEIVRDHADVLFNFLGDITGQSDPHAPLSLLGLKTTSDIADDFPQESPLALSIHIEYGRLSVSITWHPGEFEEQQMTELLEQYISTLHTVVALCMK
jgi:non-ribosomal peptide synthase domain TIGR01720